MPKIDQEQLDFILQSAILAPSADNRHRIRFQVDADTITIHCTEKLQYAHGYKRVLVLMSLGAVVENLAIAASRFGMEAQTLLSGSAQNGFSIQIRLNSSHEPVNPLWEAIPLRHTNRRIRFRGPKLSDAEISSISSNLSAYPETQLLWLNASKQRNQVLQLMRRAETERFSNPILHEELFSAIRFDVGWNATCELGLPPGALAVEAPMRPLFAMLRHWPLMKISKLLGTHYILGFRACGLPCRLAPNLGILTVKDTSDQALFNTGRSFQRLWLSLTKQGRVLQAFPASALYALDGATQEGVTGQLHTALKQGWDTLLQGKTPLMLFRTGYAPPININAGRQAIDYY